METVSWLNFFIASTTVLGLMALLGWGLKVLAARGLLRPQYQAGRLRILAAMNLDSRRRLVLTRCDDTEYLLLLGVGGDLLLSNRPAVTDKKEQA